MQNISHDIYSTTTITLLDLDARWEGVLQLIQVRDDQDLCKIGLDRVDGLDQALTSLGVLRAETFVDDQCL